MQKIGLFFGSFNPIHIGHLIIANHFAEFTNLDEVWFVVSPQNPFKDAISLLDKNKRLEMVKLAISGYPKLSVTEIEFNLPKPSYTINTLNELSKTHDNRVFSLIVGSDNLSGFTRWKDYRQIIEVYNVYAYPRPNKNKIRLEKELKEEITIVEAPQMEISSSLIRKMLSDKKNIKPLVSTAVFDYIQKHKLYTN